MHQSGLYYLFREVTEVQSGVNRKVEREDEKRISWERMAPLPRDNDLLVYFGRYCKSCKHEKLEENEPPCDECLEHPVNLNSHKPINYEDKSD